MTSGQKIAIPDSGFDVTVPWRDLNAHHFDALVLPGGHAPGMRIGRHYRTYPAYVQDEVQSILENSTHQFKEGPFVLTKRGTRNDHKYAFVVKDENYISARWPGDAYFFSRTLIEMLKKNTAHFIVLFALLFAACVPKKPNSAVKENSVSNSFSFDDYAKMCYLALGNAPEVDCSTSDLPGKYITQPIGNWKKNTLSEIRLTGEELNPAHSNSQNLTDPESLDPSMKFECINDSWILGSGTTWPRCNGISVVQKTLSQSPQGEKVTWIASCRLNNDTRISGTGQMGIIGYNETTGATCFFNKSSLKTGPKIPSANSPGAATVYDNWNLIKRSTPCVNCHQSSPWIHSPELMPERMHEVLKDSAFSKNITHKNSLQWLKNPLKINHQTPLVPSGLDKTEAKIRNKGIPYIVVGREQLENVTNEKGDKIFFAGSWTPKRMDPATPKAKYCFACHDNVSAPINPQMEFMFQQRGLGILDAEFGKNWHDVLFKTKLNQDKLTEFLSMNRKELQDSWKEYIQK